MSESSALPADLDYLFDPSLVPEIVKANLPEGIIARPLARDDYTRNHISLLTNLTSSPPLTEQVYTSQFDTMKSCPNTYYNLVLHHLPSDTIIATATVVIELKFIRGGAKIGHVEDVVVDPKFGGQGLGARLIKGLVALARSLGCYKTILDCSRENVGFYQKCGFEQKEIEMACYSPADSTSPSNV